MYGRMKEDDVTAPVKNTAGFVDGGKDGRIDTRKLSAVQAHANAQAQAQAHAQAQAQALQQQQGQQMMFHPMASMMQNPYARFMNGMGQPAGINFSQQQPSNSSQQQQQQQQQQQALQYMDMASPGFAMQPSMNHYMMMDENQRNMLLQRQAMFQFQPQQQHPLQQKQQQQQQGAFKSTGGAANANANIGVNAMFPGFDFASAFSANNPQMRIHQGQQMMVAFPHQAAAASGQNLANHINMTEHRQNANRDKILAPMRDGTALKLEETKRKAQRTNSNSSGGSGQDKSSTSSKKKSTQPRSSKFRGVSWHKRDKAWIARVWYDSKSIHVGVYSSEERAALAVDMKLEELGITTGLNFPDAQEREKLLAKYVEGNKSIHPRDIIRPKSNNSSSNLPHVTKPEKLPNNIDIESSEVPNDDIEGDKRSGANGNDRVPETDNKKDHRDSPSHKKTSPTRTKKTNSPSLKRKSSKQPNKTENDREPDTSTGSDDNVDNHTSPSQGISKKSKTN